MVEQRTSLEAGQAVIRAAARDLPEAPGVYRMLDAAGAALYVGKARALKRRVLSYTHVGKLPVRLQRMVAQTAAMEFSYTASEVEALLLECNLIKTLQPRFNILLRDDKSFPYILVTGDHDYPLITKHRGAKNRKGQYFGPFASAGDVNRTIDILQRGFKLRNCSDYNFAQRTRPCLQYQIKRCTAPCVGKVSQADYGAQVRDAAAFLSGKSRAVQERMSAAMKAASAEQRYEEAADYRDRIQALAAIRARQDVYVEGLKDADVLGLAIERGRACVQVFFFRGGQNFGNRAYFPRHAPEDTAADILASFIGQFYASKAIPRAVLVSHAPSEQGLLAQALTEQAGHKVQLSRPQRGQRRSLIDMAVHNAREALARRYAEQASQEMLLGGVAELFDLDEAPRRIEVYDNSHISGTDMVGAMIVAGSDGFEKKSYRKFNIRQAGAADDYGMMREVLGRRFKRALSGAGGDAGVIGGADWPDVLLIDGGRGQYNAAREVLEEMGISDSLRLVAIAKGEDRNAGREIFFVAGREPFQLPITDPVLQYLQRLRDEAHRFAIGAHRARRALKISASPLDEIAGVGAARKKELLHYFGSAKAVADARLEDLERVPGVSKALARKVYEHFR